MTEKELTAKEVTEISAFMQMEFKEAAAVVALAIDLARLENAPKIASAVAGYIPRVIELLHAARKQLDGNPL